jgi:hypothetical protein
MSNVLCQIGSRRWLVRAPVMLCEDDLKLNVTQSCQRRSVYMFTYKCRSYQDEHLERKISPVDKWSQL